MAVRHMQGEYSPCLYSLNWICRKLALSFDFFISDVRREAEHRARRVRGEIGGCRNSLGEKRTA
jgi:hypothetical protein